jgi:hypothetical protein
MGRPRETENKVRFVWSPPRAAYQAYGTKDRAAIEKLIADEFSVYQSTRQFDNRIDRTTYFARCW